MSLPRLTRLVRVALCSVNHFTVALPYSVKNLSRLQSSLTVSRVNYFSGRTFSTTMNRVVTYDDVVTYIDKPQILLIDVREPKELLDTGIIPSSINIPLGDVTNSLQITGDEFKKKYGRNQPNKDTEIVFTCKMGGRATKAMDAAIQLGFANSKVYKGSWDDWVSKRK